MRRGTRPRAARASHSTREPSDDQLRLIKQMGWTLTAESYIRAMFHPDVPVFPLDDDVLASVPDDLPDDVPFTLEELLATSDGLPAATQRLLDEIDSLPNRPRGPDAQQQHDEALLAHERKHGVGNVRITGPFPLPAASSPTPTEIDGDDLQLPDDQEMHDDARRPPKLRRFT